MTNYPNTIEEIKAKQAEIEALLKTTTPQEERITITPTIKPQEPTKETTTTETTIKEPANETITKRQASIEVIRIHKQKKLVAIMGIAGSFITAIISIFSLQLSAVVAGALSIGLAYFIITGEQQIKRLTTTYNINLKALA